MHAVKNTIEFNEKSNAVCINTEIEQKLIFSGRELALLFWNLDSTEQVEFFEYLSNVRRLRFQLQAILEDSTPNCRNVMCMIGEYSKPFKGVDS